MLVFMTACLSVYYDNLYHYSTMSGMAVQHEATGDPLLPLLIKTPILPKRARREAVKGPKRG